MAQGLLIVDVQNELVEALDPARRKTLFTNVNLLAERARDRGIPIVYVRHGDDGLRQGTQPWEIATEIGPHANEPIVDKHFGDAFKETDLGDVLAARNIDHVVICGMQSDFCVDATARGARERGYGVTLAQDAHATYPSGGKTEAQIHDELHAGLRALDVELVPSASALRPVK
ncbi:MAG: cysteine hydrolase [Candidatus Eremiobacteraeota bacterium]|nr:cysteine hydrolase [Candidatus Eremiobacteraeota bacterium]